jgi:hypothetical protein
MREMDSKRRKSRGQTAGSVLMRMKRGTMKTRLAMKLRRQCGGLRKLRGTINSQ